MSTALYDLQSLLGGEVGGRCWPVFNSSPTPGTTYITYQVVSGTDTFLTSGSTDETIRVQIDINGPTYDGVHTILAAVKAAFVANDDLIASEIDWFDTYLAETKEYVVTIDCYIWQ